MKVVQQNKVKLTVSLPRLYEGYTEAIQQQIAAGALGQLTLSRTRLSHNGATKGWLPEHFFNAEQCGGGAMIDLGCHPMYLARRFLGMPEQVSAQYGFVTGKEVEDNAVSLLHYANGALGVVEAGFVNSHSPFVIELHGTEGTILYSQHDNRILLRTNQNTEWQPIDIPQDQPTSFQQWVNHIQQDTIDKDNTGMALDLTRLMEASNRSAAERRAIRINELTE